MAKRTVTIESSQGNALRVQVEADIVDKFVKAATDRAGSFRGKDESFQNAIESAVAVALAKFTEK